MLIDALTALNPFVAAALHNLRTLLVLFNAAWVIGDDPDAQTKPPPSFPREHAMTAGGHFTEQAENGNGRREEVLS
jgi:hypothetical protein